VSTPPTTVGCDASGCRRRWRRRRWDAVLRGDRRDVERHAERLQRLVMSLMPLAAVTIDVASELRSLGGVTSHEHHGRLALDRVRPKRSAMNTGRPCVLIVYASPSPVDLMRSARIDLWMSLF
jgi:hypothetical protein